MMLQVRNLHTREGEAAPIPCFSAEFASHISCASRRVADEFGQSLVIPWETFIRCDCSVHPLAKYSSVTNKKIMISNSWYDMLNFQPVMLLLDISTLSFPRIIFAAQYWKCKKENRLLSVDLESQSDKTATALLLETFVPTQCNIPSLLNK
jgi:hypothetical protein